MVLCVIQKCCVLYKNVVCNTKMLCVIQKCCVLYKKCCVLYRNVVCDTNMLCVILKKCCVLYRNVVCYTKMLTRSSTNVFCCPVVTGMYMKVEVFWHVLLEHAASVFTVFTKVHGIISQKMYIGSLCWTFIGCHFL